MRLFDFHLFRFTSLREFSFQSLLRFFKMRSARRIPSMVAAISRITAIFLKVSKGSHGRDGEPFRYVRHIADSRLGRQLSRDARAPTTAPPSANSWPTAKTVQYVATIGSSFWLQRYYIFRNRQINIRVVSNHSPGSNHAVILNF